MKSAHATFQSDAMSDQIRNEAELIRSLGMTGAAFNRWNQLRSAALGDQLKSADIGGGLLQPDQNTAPFFAIRDAGFGRVFGFAERIDPRRDDRWINPNGMRIGTD